MSSLCYSRKVAKTDYITNGREKKRMRRGVRAGESKRGESVKGRRGGNIAREGVAATEEGRQSGAGSRFLNVQHFKLHFSE